MIMNVNHVDSSWKRDDVMIPISKPFLGEEEKRAVLEVMDSGMLAQGAVVKDFENAFSRYMGCAYSIATSSGTSALQVILTALGIKKGDEVITTPLSFFASTSTIIYCGAKPVFADILEDTFNIDPVDIEKKVTDSTKAILPVHLFGQSAAMDEILAIANNNGLRVVEDACQSHGATYKSKKVGTMGDAGCFSFYPTKNMTTGEGGMITTNNNELDELCRMYRDHGASEKYQHKIIGYNYRLNDIFAAIGREQLKKLDGFTAKRVELARKMNEKLEDVDWLVTPKEKEGYGHVFHLYTVVLTGKMRNKQKDFITHLRENGVGAREGYPVPIYKQPAVQNMEYAGDCPVAEEVMKKMVHLPLHVGLSDEHVERIVNAVKSFGGTS